MTKTNPVPWNPAAKLTANQLVEVADQLHMILQVGTFEHATLEQLAGAVEAAREHLTRRLS